jgi:endonuclease/exonuclease/phosphatase family metal-dependent hydrolase
MSLPTSTLPPLSWRAPADPGASTPREWCDAVGPAATHEGTLPAPSADQLVVASWNVHAGGGDVLSFVRDLRSGAFTGTPVHTFVLLLQEAHRTDARVPPPSAVSRLTSRIDAAPAGGTRVDVLKAARLLGVHAFYVPSMPNGIGEGAEAPEDRGNAVLSTLPLSELSAIELPFEVQRRVAVAATLTGTDSDGRAWKLRVASGHLDTRSPMSRFLDSFGAGRARQASALGAWLEGDAVLLGADLNTWSLGFLEDALDVLKARFPDTPSGGEPTFTAAGVVGRRLDHLLARLPAPYRVDVRRVGDRYGSDHYPLVGVVRFRGEEGDGAGPGPLAGRPSAGAAAGTSPPAR